MRMLDAIILFSASIESVLAVPHLILPPSERPSIPFDSFQLQQPPRPHSPQFPRHANPLSSLLIPDCALSCYLQTLPDDGCALEIDLKCHCSTGNILGKAEACVEAACSRSDQEDAKRKVAAACQAVGINPSLPASPASTAASSSTASSRAASTEAVTTTSSPPVYSMGSTTRVESTATPPPPSNDSPSDPPSSSSATHTTASSISAETMSQSPRRTSTSAPTHTSFPVPISDHGLSDGAKAGISVSVLFVASAIFIALSLYIRRLKRQLALAKAAANVPDSVLRSPSHRHSGIPEALFTPSRRRSWSATPRNSRRLSRRDGMMSESPVSPLSPVFFRDGGRRTSIAGVMNKKRVNTLSIVVEREDEDASSLMTRGRSIREPVPGQSEGLVAPLEMDGEFAAIFEAPTSITPRARSTERDREEWKEYDFGKF